MPNHVEQDLVITGLVITLKEFLSFAEEEGDVFSSPERINVLSANKFLPYPEEYAKLDDLAQDDPFAKDGFNSGGFEWCIKNWGTQWGIYSSSLLINKLNGKKGKLKYTCKSAWSPCLPVINAMSKKFPDLKFDMRYFERGMGFKGHYVVQNGEILINEKSIYNGRRGG